MSEQPSRDGLVILATPGAFQPLLRRRGEGISCLGQLSPSNEREKEKDDPRGTTRFSDG